MPIVTIVFGLILIVLGVASYFGTGQVSKTALIPAFFGIPVLICGILALKESMLKHAMHGAAMLGVIGALGSFPGVIKLLKSLGGAELERPAAVYAQTVMAVLCIVFVALCVKSFIDTRRRRGAAS